MLGLSPDRAPGHPGVAATPHALGMTAHHLVAAVHALGGVATRAQLMRFGYTGYALTRAVRAGIVLRIRRSRYALVDTDTATRTAIELGGRLGGLSAAREYGWWTGLDTRIHVSWPAHGNVAKPGRVFFGRRPEVVHHWRILRDSERPRSDDLRREPPLEALAQVLVACDRETAVACADSAIHSGLVTDREVRALFRRMPPAIARWECYLDGRSDSGIESIVRIWLIDRGIPFVFHALVDGHEVDFLIGTSLVMQTDGSEFHDSKRDAARDARQDFSSSIRGYLTMRVRYAYVMYDPGLWQARLLEQLARGDHRRLVV
jgi:hypothetical protein